MPRRSSQDRAFPAPLWMVTSALPGVVALLLARRGKRTPPASIRIQGEGRVRAVPDVAVVSLGVETRHEAPTAAYGRGARLADELIQALRAEGVADVDIRTTGVGLHPEYAAKPDGQHEITGWRASHMLSVKLRAIDGVPAMLERTVGILGADGRINSIEFRVDDTDALLIRARSAAFENARQAAERLLQTANRRLGAMIAIEDAAVASPVPRAGWREGGGMRMMAMSADAGGEVMPGQVDVSARVVVEFAVRRR